MRTYLTLTAGLAVLLVGASIYAQEPRKIEFKMQPGESLTYTLHAETTTDTTRYPSRGTEKRTMIFKSDMQVLLRCVQVSEKGIIHAEITYPKFSMETSVTEGGQTTRIVTDNDGARSYVDGKLQEQTTWQNLEADGKPNLAKLFGSLISCTFNKRGKVTDVKVPPALDRRFTWMDMKQFFQHQVILPEAPVTPGSEWNDTTEREVPPGPGPLSRQIMIDEASYNYQKNETASGRECARVQAVISSRPKEKIRDMTEFNQKNEGWSLISLENGHLVASEMKLFQEMKGTPGGIKTEVTTKGEVRTNLVLPSPPAETPAEEKAPDEAK